MRATVLVLSHWFDVTADYVVRELNRRGVPVFRFEAGDFPQNLTLAGELGPGWTGNLRTAERTALLDDVICAYYRRPLAFEFPAGLSKREKAWASAQALAGLGGILGALPRWLNHPATMMRADAKAYQLSCASQVGLDVPRTIVTNDPGTAAEFGATVGDVIYKPLTAPVFLDDDGNRRLFTPRSTRISSAIRGSR